MQDMSSTKKVFGVPGIWVPMAVMLFGGAVSFFGWEYPFGGDREEKKERIADLEEPKNRLPASAPLVEKVKIKESKPKKRPQPVAHSSLALESLSDEEHQSVILEHVKASDRQLVEQLFKQENAFKTSLKPSEKQRFDVDVKNACAKLLSISGVQEGEMSSFLKQIIRRCAESMVITDWRRKDSVDRKNAELNTYLGQREENLRILQEEFLAETDKETEAE